MGLETQVTESIKTAMRAKDSEALDALRAIKAAFLNLNASGKEVTEETRLKSLQSLVKQRNDSASIFKEQNREDLYKKEVFQISVIEKFLPQKLSDIEVEEEVKLAITESGATSIKEMGKVIGIVSKKLVGQADGKVISEIVKKLLS